MRKSFETLANILHDWGKDKYKKVLPKYWTGTRNIVYQEKFNKPNKQNVYEIDSFNKFNFS